MRSVAEPADYRGSAIFRPSGTTAKAPCIPEPSEPEMES